MAEPISKKVGAAFAQRRRAASMTQEDLASESGLTTTYIGMVERGEKNVTLAAANRIAHALKVALSSILEEIGE